MKPSNHKSTLIESDEFPFEFLSRLAERESWRKEVHRPIYHVHKWWANRLGSVFRGILLGAVLPEDADLAHEFYQTHALTGLSVLDPFMGSGTTIGEAHKLGMTALGRDINPVAVNAATTAFGSLDRRTIRKAFQELAEGTGKAPAGTVPFRRLERATLRRALSLLGDAGELPALRQARRPFSLLYHRSQCIAAPEIRGADSLPVMRGYLSRLKNRRSHDVPKLRA